MSSSQKSNIFRFLLCRISSLFIFLFFIKLYIFFVFVFVFCFLLSRVSSLFLNLFFNYKVGYLLCFWFCFFNYEVEYLLCFCFLLSWISSSTLLHLCRDCSEAENEEDEESDDSVSSGNGNANRLAITFYDVIDLKPTATTTTIENVSNVSLKISCIIFYK
jgi:hypothetical protein